MKNKNSAVQAKTRTLGLKRWSIRTLVIGTCGVLSLAGSNVMAHEDDEILEEVIIEAGRWQNPTGAMVSASEGVVGQVEIDSRPRLRTGEILEVVPGLIVTQHSGSGKSNQMFLRGFNLDHGTDFATWVDGMPVNNPTHGHGQGYTDLNFIIPELVRQIEFRKGPYYSEVSDFSSAGAAYMTTFSRLDEGLLKVGFGENGYGRILAADSFEVAGGDLLLGGQRHVYDGPWVGVEENLNRYNGVARYHRKSETREWNLMFMAYDASWDSADQVPLRAVESGLVDELGTIDDTVGGDSSRFSLSGSWHQDSSYGKFKARGYMIDYELDLFSNFTYFLDDPVNGDQFEQVDDRQIFGGDVNWALNPVGRHQQNIGLMVRHDDINDVGLFRTSQRQRLSTVRQDKVAQTSVGLYYDVDTEWNEKWRTSFGLRADYYYFDIKESTLAENTGTDNDFLLTPKFNVIYALSDSTELFFSAGRAFHSNDARGVVIETDPVSGDPAEKVDPLVTSDGAELGFRTFYDQRLNLSASLWYLTLESELLFVGDAGNTEASRPSRRYGIEIPVYYRINDAWTLDLEMSFSEAEFEGSDPGGDEIPGSLDRVISAGVSYNTSGGWYGSARMRHFGERPLIEDNSFESDPSTVFNMSVGYRRNNWDFRLDALNLFDERDDDITYFYQSRLPGEPAEGFEDVHYHPMEPRSLRAHVTWRF
ncbi:MAG: TonB-dependent receptor [Gammaproteobacteria bacterium]